MTTAETFIWYRAHPRVSLGVAHLWKQNSLRWLASVNLSSETPTFPAINASVGVQGIGTGNPGYSVTFEKNFSTEYGKFNAFVGPGFRSNENHTHLVAGFKYTPADSPITIGIQLDGHQYHPFITYAYQQYTTGFFLIDGKSPAYMVGVRF